MQLAAATAASAATQLANTGMLVLGCKTLLSPYTHLTCGQLCDAWQLELVLCDAGALCPCCCVLLAELPALLVLDGAEDTEAAVSTSRQQPQTLQQDNRCT
jgi:hypothetical protein